MSGALFSRLKVWGTTDVVTSADLNAEFDNVLNNFISTMMQGYSATVGQMQTQVSPGGLGTESLASAVSDELARIRFVLAEITGQTYWYQAPVASLAQLNSSIGAASFANKINSGLTTGTTGSLQPIFLLAAGSSAKVTLKGSGTPFIYSIAGTTYTISTDVAITGLTLAPSSSNTAVVNDTSISAQTWTKIVGENGTALTIATVGLSISNLVGKYAAFKNNTSSEYFIARVGTSTSLVDIRRGYFFNSSNAIVGRSAVTNGDVISLMQLTWLYATTGGALVAGYTNPTYSGTAPSSPSIGDYWFDQVHNVWKTYGGSSWVASASTLVGFCIQDTANCVGTRSFDFFESYSATNTAELIIDQTTVATVRSRYIGAQTSVYGTLISQGEGYLSWTTPSNNISGVTVTNGNTYYFYVDNLGNTLIDSIPPYDRRSDLLGFYHPVETYRCLGYAYANGTNIFSSVETFYRGDTAAIIQNITQATPGNNVPIPDSMQVSPYYLTIDTSGGSYTQLLPPVAAFKGKTITYVKTSADYNICTLQVFEPTILTTTQSSTFAQTTVTCASSTGITTGLLVQGLGIPRGVTVTAFTGATATLSQPVFTTSASAAVTFGQAGGIANNISVTLATQFELWTFFSTGTQWIAQEHGYPTDWVNFPSVAASTFITAVTTAPAYGTVVENIARWRRQGDSQQILWTYAQSTAGTAGSGIYLLNNFSGAPTFNTSISGTNASADNTRSTVGSFSWRTIAGIDVGYGAVKVWSTTQLYADFVFVNNSSGQGSGVWQSGTGPAFNGTGNAFSIQALIPMTGWVG